MKVTEVVWTPHKDGNLEGFASITLDGCFVVKGLRVIDGKNGYFVSMPSKLGADKEWHDICFPINKELRQEILDSVLKEANLSKEEEDDEIPF